MNDRCAVMPPVVQVVQAVRASISRIAVVPSASRTVNW